MVVREDLQLSHLPASSCANCGFLLQDLADSDGQNYRPEQPVSLNERAIGLNYLDGNIYMGTNAKVASLRCWMRRDFPGNEARPGLSGDTEAKRLILAAMHRDRSIDSDAYCPQFTPWVLHLSLEDHWRERRALKQDEGDRNFQRDIHRSAQRTQLLIAFLATCTIAVTVLVGWWTTTATRQAVQDQLDYQRQNPPPTPVFAPVFNAPPVNVTVTVPPTQPSASATPTR